mmetsp:Transcript_28554/g.13210  ORF Transcript_28554/g.13210 Transcript_28554/m.13210 type:complete len:259 (+) Transcript_28554:2778-3554(+)
MKYIKKKRQKYSNSSAFDLKFIKLDIKKLPSHIAIIMDGNGRWAKKNLQDRIKGHNKGADTVRNIVETCCEINIQTLTLYAFSTENWQRPKTEVAALMTLLNEFLSSEKKSLIKNNIRLNVIGQIYRLPANAQKAIKEVIAQTIDNTGLILNLALSYGSREEIVTMVKHIVKEAEKGKIESESIDEKTISEQLYTKGLPDPDLLIRTGGEMRVSNFLLWQIAYSEIFITNTLWPDFTKEEFIEIIKDFQKRKRRFGKI